MCANALKVLKDFVGRQTNELCLSDFLSAIIYELYDVQLGDKDASRTNLAMNNVARQQINQTKRGNVTLVNSSSITSLNSETSVTSRTSKKSNSRILDKTARDHQNKSPINSNMNKKVVNYIKQNKARCNEKISRNSSLDTNCKSKDMGRNSYSPVKFN